MTFLRLQAIKYHYRQNHNLKLCRIFDSKQMFSEAYWTWGKKKINGSCTPKAQINILPFDLPTQTLLIEGCSRGIIANYCKYLKEAQIIYSIIHAGSFYLNSLVCECTLMTTVTEKVTLSYHTSYHFLVRIQEQDQGNKVLNTYQTGALE